MFTGKRYLTRGLQAEIPFELHLFMWCCIDNLQDKKDYFQIFELEKLMVFKEYITFQNSQSIAWNICFLR